MLKTPFYLQNDFFTSHSTRYKYIFAMENLQQQQQLQKQKQKNTKNKFLVKCIKNV